MLDRVGRAGAAVGGLGLAIGLVLPVALPLGVRPGPARGDDCDKVDAWYYDGSGTRRYVTPWAPGACVVPTPGWPLLVGPFVDEQQEWLPGPLQGAGASGQVTSP